MAHANPLNSAELAPARARLDTLAPKHTTLPTSLPFAEQRVNRMPASQHGLSHVRMCIIDASTPSDSRPKEPVGAPGYGPRTAVKMCHGHGPPPVHPVRQGPIEEPIAAPDARIVEHDVVYPSACISAHVATSKAPRGAETFAHRLLRRTTTRKVEGLEIL